jgi:uncharacterized protein (TIGR03085 family)
MTRHAQLERQALCDLFDSLGPDAPTLCEGWLTRDLAAHLVVREHRPDAQAGILAAPLAGYTAKVQGAAARTDWPTLVRQVRSGPPRWSPTRIGAVDEAINLAEFFVHHEDVRRAQPSWTARDLPADLSAALWRVCRTMSRLSLRRMPVGVELVAPGHGRVVARKGHPVVRVEGPPAEILLFALGRRDVARVDLDGPDQAVEQVRATPSGH